jgi:hypothetical protein
MNENTYIKIQSISEDSITLEVNGEIKRILNKLDALQELLQKQESKTFQTADKIYNIGSINEANFNYLLDKAGSQKNLPPELAENIITDENLWIESIRRELLRQRVQVGNKPLAVYQHYGWLIECFLQKMGTLTGRKVGLRRLSFMTEAFQSSLRYLSFIQLAQLWEQRDIPIVQEFFSLNNENFERFDFLNCLLQSTEALHGNKSFMPEIEGFVEQILDLRSDLYNTAIFLDQKRSALVLNEIPEDETLPVLLDQYLTALVFWLRNIVFLANYRLVSIKDINLNYRLGTAKNFVHLYGELHGMYSEVYAEQNDFIAYSIENFFTYNQSILLFKGSNIETCLASIADTASYISLSPLVVDLSIYSDKETQTPEIYYFTGQSNRQYIFAQYKNELVYGEAESKKSNKLLQVKRQNNRQPKLDELFEQLEHVFAPFEIGKR